MIIDVCSELINSRTNYCRSICYVKKLRLHVHRSGWKSIIDGVSSISFSSKIIDSFIHPLSLYCCYFLLKFFSLYFLSVLRHLISSKWMKTYLERMLNTYKVDSYTFLSDCLYIYHITITLIIFLVSAFQNIWITHEHRIDFKFIVLNR